MEIEIKDLGINGEGVGKVNSKVYFVDFALPNEIVDVEVYKEKNSFCNAKVNRIIKKCDDRVTPTCPYFGVCGGCDLEHLAYLKQEEYKKERVKRELDKYLLGAKVDNTVFDKPFGYRNKMVFDVSGYPIQIGMLKRNSHTTIEVDKCLLSCDKINDVLGISKEYFKKSNFRGYDRKTCKGDIKHLVIRACGNEILVTIVATKMLHLKDYFEYLNGEIKKAYNEIKIGLSIVISDSENEILSGQYKHLFGLEYLKICEFGIEYKINNLGFLQVNDVMKEKMYSRVLDEIGENGSVIDAYSGAGLMSAIVSKKAKNVVGIEVNKSASKSAENLAKDNNLNNVKYICEKVENVIGNVLDNMDDVTVILDPPRSGCDGSVCDKILENSSKINKIIYISCNPSTLRRDIERLSEKYRISKITPFDLFPNTKHIETLAILARK